jgi:hypothetical protein
MDKKELFIQKAIVKHKGVYDYNSVEYKNAKTNISIKCTEHGDFFQTPDNHLRGTGCPKCSLIKKGLRHRKSQDIVIEQFIKVHGNVYNYAKTKYIKENEPVVITCLLHDDFKQTPNAHLAGKGCRKCGVKKMSDSQRKTIEEFIKEARDIHGIKYNYNKIKYKDYHTPIIIGCPTHGDFEQRPADHISQSKGHGCRKCGDEYRGNLCRKSNEQFIKESIEIHGDLYIYDKVDYQTQDDNVTIICKIHGEFLQQPVVHLRGCGCQLCGSIKNADAKRKSTEEFIIDAVRVHGNQYNYDNVDYINARENIIIVCSEHGEFFQSPNVHLRGGGCSKCSSRFSNISKEWLDMIKINYPNLRTYDDIDGEYRIPNTNYYADGYDEKTNTIFEFQGDYWHGNPKIFQSDQINPTTKCTFGELYNKTLNKRKILEDLGYKYIEVWENDWNTLKRIILKKQRSIKSNR